MPAKNKSISYNNKINAVLFIILTFISILPAYFRGGFFQEEQTVFFSLISALFLLITYTNYKNKKFHCISSFLDIFLVVFVFSYCVSVLFAASLNLAVYEAIKYVFLLALYYSFKSFDYTEKTLSTILKFVLFGAFGVGILGVFSAVGIVNLSGAYSVGEKWINSTLQYHNTFAAYMLAGIVLATVFYFTSKKIQHKLMYTIVGYILAFGLIFSFSRGAWIVLPLVFVLIAVFSFKKYFSKLFSYNIIIFTPVIAISKFFYDAMVIRDFWKSLLFFVLGLLICVVLTFVSQIISNSFINRTETLNKTTLIIFIAAVIIGAIIIFVFPQLLLSVLPKDIAERLTSISFGAGTVKERFVFYKDALPIILESPVFGGGGNVWHLKYSMYQSYEYLSNYVHSYIVQVLTETGFFGLISYIGVLVSFVIAAVKNILREKNNENIRLLSIGVFVYALVIIVHSMIDFDLALMGITIPLYMMFAITSSMNVKSRVKATKIPLWLSIVIGLLLTVTLFSYKISVTYGNYGSQNIANEEYADAKANFKKAIAFNPLNSTYKANYVQAAISIANEKQRPLSDTETKYIESALAHDYYNITVNTTAIEYYYFNSNLDKVLELTKFSMKLRPLNSSTYENAAYVLYQGGIAAIKNGNGELGARFLTECYKIKETIEELNQNREEKIEITEYVEMVTGKAGLTLIEGQI